jgi:AcrR family transcriptional regulator
VRQTRSVTPTQPRRLTDDARHEVRRPGRPTGDRVAKRAELLDAASSVIAEDGYADLSLRKVARRAGCTTGTLTYYFANKDDLITALAEHSFDSFDAMLEASRDETDVRAFLDRWLAKVTSDAEFWPVMFQLLTHARHDPAFTAVFETRYARFRDVFRAILAAGQAAGTIRDDIPADLLADQLSAISDGWMLMLPLEPQRFTPARMQTLVDATIALIRPGPWRSARSAAPSSPVRDPG